MEMNAFRLKFLMITVNIIYKKMINVCMWKWLAPDILLNTFKATLTDAFLSRDPA
jgi:hypothetical protein